MGTQVDTVHSRMHVCNTSLPHLHHTGQGMLDSTFEGLGARFETGAGASRLVTGL